MFEKLKNIIGIFPGKYSDIRHERTVAEMISMNNGQIRQFSRNTGYGAHFRLLINGGMAVCSVTDLDNIPPRRDILINDAKISAENKKRKIIFDPQKPVIDHVRINPSRNPLDISMEEKLETLKKYCDHISSNIDCVSISGHYKMEFTDKHFCNYEGSQIRQEQLYNIINLNVFIRTRYGDLQNLALALGGSEDFSNIENQFHELEDYISQLSELKNAVPISGGRFNVILNPQLAGVFIHEAFGHLSEAEHIYYDEDLKKSLKIGNKIAEAHLNVLDDPSIPGVPGYYKYDDEGIMGKKTYIIKEGIVNSYLNDRDSAHYFSQELTGHCRANSYSVTPIIRMSNIYIDKGKYKASEIFDNMEDGYYLLNARGGQTVGNHFTFGAQFGYRIKNGKKQEMVKDINISGELFTTLMNIKEIADDFEFDRRGGCGKDGQLISKSSTGSSHIRIDNVGIGGKL